MSLRIVGLDTSLSATGIAVVDLEGDAARTTTQRIRSKPTPKGDHAAMHARIMGIGREIRRIALDGWTGQIAVAMEGPAYGAKGSAVHDIAGLWWEAYDAAQQIAAAVVVVPPATLKMYVTGKGNAPKDLVLMSIVRQHEELAPADNNEADALGLAAMVARQHGRPIESKPYAYMDAALERVNWPSLLRPRAVPGTRGTP
jgi:crossover junction endodeoxyribonuclease RuvC